MNRNFKLLDTKKSGFLKILLSYKDKFNIILIALDTLL